MCVPDGEADFYFLLPPHDQRLITNTELGGAQKDRRNNRLQIPY